MMQIQREIEAAFDGVHADEALKERTRRAVMQAAQNEARPRRRVKRGVAFAICAAAVVCVIFFGANAYFTPTSTISIDINPSIEMDVNRFDRVIDVRGYNDDGVEFASTLDVVNESYEDAIYEVLDSESVSDRLEADGVLSIAVIQSDEDQGEEIMGFIDQCTQGRGNIECYCMNAEDVSDAHSLGLSYGRYKYYLQIHEYDATVTPEQINSMSMREIRELLYELSGGEQETQDSHGGCGTQGMGNGHQYGKN